MFKTFLRSSTALHNTERGATAVEYGLITAVIALGILGSVAAVRDGMNNAFTAVSGQLNAAAAPPAPSAPSNFGFSAAGFSVSSTPLLTAADIFVGAAGPVSCWISAADTPLNAGYTINLETWGFTAIDSAGSQDTISGALSSENCEISLIHVAADTISGSFAPTFNVFASDGNDSIAGSLYFSP